MEQTEELKSFSEEHRYGLMLSWKIRQGILKGVSFDRIKKYSDWFYKTYLTPHFDAEEKLVYSILGEDDPMVKKMLASRRRLDRLFLGTKKPPEIALSLGEEKLEQHIRFEERKLFKRIREVATPEELERIERMYEEPEFEENEEDMFWEDGE